MRLKCNRDRYCIIQLPKLIVCDSLGIESLKNLSGNKYDSFLKKYNLKYSELLKVPNVASKVSAPNISGHNDCATQII